MLRNFKIKSQIMLLTGFILSIMLITQFVLYVFLQHENNNTLSLILNSISQNTVLQVEKLNSNISELSLLLSVQDDVQASLYKYTPPEIVRNIGKIQSIFNNYRERNQNIAFLGMFKNRKLFMSSETINLSTYAYDLLNNFSVAGNSKEIFTPSFVYNNRIYFACITPVFPKDISYYTSRNTDNYIVCIYEMNNISYTPYDFLDNSQIGLIITDNENRIMLSSDISELGTILEPDKKLKNFLYKSTLTESPELKITIFIPDYSINIFWKSAPRIIFSLILMTICILIIMFVLLNKIIVKKILIVKEKVAKIPINNTDYRINYKYNDELSEIVVIINQVLDQLHDLNQEKLSTLDNLYKVRILQKETQIFYLQGQVSPHFLYNSLSHIQGLAFKYNAFEIVQMVSSLANIFRYFSNNKSLSTIQQDLNCAIEYFNIINQRRENPITLTNIVDEQLLGVSCLKMIYQPILENTLKHAFTIEESGEVVISSVPDPQKAIIEITDNGRGMSEEVFRNITAQLLQNDINLIKHGDDHIGLVNVNMRLKLYYQKDCGLEIIPKTSGTCVRIIFDKKLPDTNIID